MPENVYRPPVTVLCGFLGAGKTTLLTHLMTQAAGRRWAVVVNDVASINIDGAVVRAGAGTRTSRDIFELGNGCVCCSSKDELAETVAELASVGRYDHILIETTGVAEPRSIGNLFVHKNQFGRTLGDFATLASLVSVIDAAYFLREWTLDQNRTEGREILASRERPVFELMLEQAECADVLVLNKCDLVDESALIQLENILHSLNEHAEIIRAVEARVGADFLLGRARFDAKATLGAATWLRSLSGNIVKNPAPSVRGDEAPAGAGSSPSEIPLTPDKKYGIKTFVYQSRRAFSEPKFYALLETQWPGLLRAKGYFWLLERPKEMGFVSVAGGSVRYDFPSHWWASLVEHKHVTMDQRPPVVRALWAEPHGDRRQELVFIGVGLDETVVRAALDACLCESAPAQSGGRSQS